MEWYNIEAIRLRTVNFENCNQQSALVPAPANGFEADDASSQVDAKTDLVESRQHTIGGIIQGGKWAWLVKKPGDTTLEIISLWNGCNVSKYKFEITRNNEQQQQQYRVRHVEELYVGGNTECTLLAVCLEAEVHGGARESHIALYSMLHNCQFHCIELQLRGVSCLKFINTKSCRRTLFQNYDGCLAVGSEEGILVLLDLNIEHRLAEFEALLQSKENSSRGFDGHTGCAAAQLVNYSEKISNVMASFRKCREEDLNFGLRLEAIDEPFAITSLLPLDVVLGLAAGTADGRIVLYDLTEMFFITVVEPPNRSELRVAAVEQMCCLVPLDDPRPCYYICALYNDGESLYTALYAFMYEKRIEEEEQVFSFANFLTHVSKLRLFLENSPSYIIGCQSISKLTGHNDAISICVISWHSVLEEKNKILIFDLNQWYKEQMPHGVVGQKNPTFLAGYILSGLCRGINVQMIPKSIAHFNSLHRYEEHFYPNSLSFDCYLLQENSCRTFKWVGAQNQFINLLRRQNSTIFLNPRLIYEEILRTRLMPQFCEQNRDSTFSKSALYELILSVALENNCINLLRDCARSWLDGSFMCNFSIPTELSLSTLTNWIFKRANQIKNRCNEICQGVFQTDSYPLDDRERKELRFISRQLSLLSELEQDILKNSKSVVPTDAFNKLASQEMAIHMATDYQELLNWMLNIGLLPQQPDNEFAATQGGAPYPVAKLRQIYNDKRKFFEKISKYFIRTSIGSCRLLFIDVLMHQDHEQNVMIDYWPKSNGLYPPASIEELLHIMLVPDLDFQQKCAVILYFLLDLNMLEDLSNKHIVADFIKFQSVFKLSASLVKTVEAFWSLDHGHFVMSVEQFLSPVNSIKQKPLWQVELIIESLITQKSNSLALGILESHIGAVSSLLRLKTLLANDMIAEAFQLARAKEFESEKSLVEIFFASCVHASKFDVLRDLVISNREEQILQRVLRECKTPGVERVHFAYLLQKSKYLEAVSYMDEISQNRASSNLSSTSSTSMCNNGNDDLSPNLMLTAYNTTMAPVQQSLTDIYFRIRNKIRLKEINDFHKAPVPFSSQLIKQDANSLLGGIYHSAALSAHFATYYWGDLDAPTHSTQSNANANGFPNGRDPMSTNNAPFLRKPQNETNQHDLLARFLPVSRPVPYEPAKKRKQEIETVIETKPSDQPRKRRRLIAEKIQENMTHFVNEKLADSSAALTNNNNNMPLEVGDSIDDTVQVQSSVLTAPIPTISCSNSPQRTVTREINSGGSPLPGILKSDMTTYCPILPLPETLKDAEKNLRFDLTNVNVEDSVEMMDNIDDSQTDEIVAPPTPQPQLLPVNREVTETVSANSSRRSSISSSAHSENEFYSPINSAHTSLAMQPIIEDEFEVEADKSCLELGPKPRASLQNVHMDVMQNDEREISEQQQSATTSSCRSSGFGSLKSTTDIGTAECTLKTTQLQPVSTTTTTTTTSSLNVVQSKMSEFFVPMVCSSKVGATQSKFMQRGEDIAKISECTTIVGSLNSQTIITHQTHIDEETEANETTTQLPSNTESQRMARQRMFDTTIEMTTEDFMSPDDESSQSELIQQQTLVDDDVEDNIVHKVGDLVPSLPIEHHECSRDSDVISVYTDSENKDDSFSSTVDSDEEKKHKENEDINAATTLHGGTLHTSPIHVVEIDSSNSSSDSSVGAAVSLAEEKSQQKPFYHSKSSDTTEESQNDDAEDNSLENPDDRVVASDDDTDSNTDSVITMPYKEYIEKLNTTAATTGVDIDDNTSSSNDDKLSMKSKSPNVQTKENKLQLRYTSSSSCSEDDKSSDEDDVKENYSEGTEQHAAEMNKDDDVDVDEQANENVISEIEKDPRADITVEDMEWLVTDEAHESSATEKESTDTAVPVSDGNLRMETESVEKSHILVLEENELNAGLSEQTKLAANSNETRLVESESIKSKSSNVVNNDTVQRECDKLLLRYTSSSSSEDDESSNSSLTVVTEQTETRAPAQGDVKENYNEDTAPEDEAREMNKDDVDQRNTRTADIPLDVDEQAKEVEEVKETHVDDTAHESSETDETQRIQTESGENKRVFVLDDVAHGTTETETELVSGVSEQSALDAVSYETHMVETESAEPMDTLMIMDDEVHEVLSDTEAKTVDVLKNTISPKVEKEAVLGTVTSDIVEETNDDDSLPSRSESENQSHVLRRSRRSVSVPLNLDRDDTDAISVSSDAAIGNAAGTPTRQRRYSLRATSSPSISELALSATMRKRATATTVPEPEQRQEATDLEQDKIESRTKRGSSVPLNLQTNTPQSGLRKRAMAALEVISETDALLTPTTRSRRRLNSGAAKDAENVATPKRTRRSSLTATVDTASPATTPRRRSLRSSSVDINGVEPAATTSTTQRVSSSEVNPTDPDHDRDRDNDITSTLRTRRQQRAVSETKMLQNPATETTKKEKPTTALEVEQPTTRRRQRAVSESKTLSTAVNTQDNAAHGNDSDGSEKSTVSLRTRTRRLQRKHSESKEQTEEVTSQDNERRLTRTQMALMASKSKKSPSLASGSNDGSGKRSAATTSKQRTTTNTEISTIAEEDDEDEECASDETDASLKSSQSNNSKVNVRIRRQVRSRASTSAAAAAAAAVVAENNENTETPAEASLPSSKRRGRK